MIEKYGFETITTTDHRAWLWVVSILSLLYSGLVLGARVTGKWELLHYDDAVLGVAYVFAFAHYGILFKAILCGLGASTLVIPQALMTNAAEYYFISRVLAFCSLCFSKTSIIMFTRRIFTGDLNKENVFFATAYAITALYGVCGVLLSSAGCRPEQSLVTDANAVCDANIARWIVITVLDVLTEISLVALPLWFISKNNLKASKKGVVVFVYSFRLIVATLSVASSATYFEYLKRSQATSIDAAPTIAWQEVLLGFSLISASIPCLRSFLWAFKSTGLMTIYGNYGTGSHGDTTRMPSDRLQDRPSSPSQNRDDQQPSRSLASRLRPERLEYRIDIRAEHRPSKKELRPCVDAESPSVKSEGSEHMIIRHTREINIKHS
ncbi:hypothetical protein LTR37_008768 [Vermiconidia calcicola]|uniref:Uncharacterized protein n=1 Tax=Vermiconidia calcicola TaxID=1690605 RepID=A0ACC3N9V4_9PEZI|nr:hypothetical protein LTR37_008768 [Vermiconidia calcicola]